MGCQSVQSGNFYRWLSDLCSVMLLTSTPRLQTLRFGSCHPRPGGRGDTAHIAPDREDSRLRQKSRSGEAPTCRLGDLPSTVDTTSSNGQASHVHSLKNPFGCVNARVLYQLRGNPKPCSCTAGWR